MSRPALTYKTNLILMVWKSWKLTELGMRASRICMQDISHVEGFGRVGLLSLCFLLVMLHLSDCGPRISLICIAKDTMIRMKSRKD